MSTINSVGTFNPTLYPGSGGGSGGSGSGSHDPVSKSAFGLDHYAPSPLLQYLTPAPGNGSLIPQPK